MVPYIIHDIADILSLPLEVLSIIDRFHAPLTPDLANVAQGSLSVGSFEIYREALKSPVLSLDADNTRWTKEIPITHLIDTTLAFVKTLRVVSSPCHIHRFGSRPTYGTWASFITTLGFASSETAFVMSDAQFLLPRTVGSTEAKPTSVFEGNASVLIAWAILPKKREQANIEVENSSENSQQEQPDDEVEDVTLDNSQCGSDSKELEDEVTMEDEDEFGSDGVEDITADQREVDDEVDYSSLGYAKEEYYDDEVVHSGSEMQSEEPEDLVVSNVDAPLSQNPESSDSENSQSLSVYVEAPDDGHILPGTGRRINCLLPSLCVADKDNVRHLVTSVVYQRYTWGIFLPTIGMEIEGNGTTARVLIGWIDEKNLQLVEQLPSVHLAFCSDLRVPHPSRGVYDLLDPASTLHFAQFILWTAEHLSIIGELANNAVPRDFCWRLDHRRFNNSTCNPHDNIAYQNPIETWRSSIASELPDHLPLPDEDQTNIMVEELKSQQLITGFQTGIVDPGPRSTDCASSGMRSLEPPLSDVSEKYSNAPSSCESSASAFAALKPAGTAVEAIKRGERGTDLWLWDRLTIRISRMAFSGSQDPSRLEINTKVEHYDNIMKLMFPKQWAELDNMPNCDKAAIEIREQLHKDLGAEGPAIAVDGELESAMKCFANHPAALYNAIKEAQKYREQEKLGVHVPEAQTQRVWDNLLHAYTSSHGKAQSSFPVEPLPLSYHHEKTLRFPINDRVKNPLRYPPKEQAQLQHGFALKQVCELERLNISLDSPVHSILAKAFHDATALSAFFSSNSPRAPTPRDDEPSTGRADSVLVIVVPPANPHPAAKPRELALSGNILQLYDTKAFHLERIPSPVVSSTMHELCLMCPEVIEHLGNRTGTCPQVHPVAGYHNASLCVPFFCVENKKDDKTVLQAFNQCRIYCISCVKFLAALGIVGFPVYGLVTTGLQGTIMVAWNSQELTGKKGVVDAKDKCDFTILMDSYLVSFDLTIPLEAYRFMLAVHRIYLYGLELQDEIKKQNLEDILTRPGFADWAMPPKARTPKLQGN